MKRSKTSKLPNAPTADELERLRHENAHLREPLEDLLIILGNPAGYCEDDRREVAEAILEIHRALGDASQSTTPAPAATAAAEYAGGICPVARTAHANVQAPQMKRPH